MTSPDAANKKSRDSLLTQLLAPIHVVSTSEVASRAWSQIYFAAMLPQRSVVGGRLCVALRRLHTVCGDATYDHLRVARYPQRARLIPLALSPAQWLIAGARARGVSRMQVSLMRAAHEPDDWREARATWVLRGHAQPALAPCIDAGLKAGGTLSFRADLDDADGLFPRHLPTAPPALERPSLAMVSFSSVRLALDALEEPAARRARQPCRPGPLAWELCERVSLREMLSP